SLDDSIAGGKTLSVEGGTRVTISAVAYKGAKVVATLNGQTISLKQQEAQLDDRELSASYAMFTGRYKVPDGVTDRVQSLGKIGVTADFMGYTRSLVGAEIKVNALPPPPPVTDINVNMYDQDSAGSGEVVGRIDPVRAGSEAVTYVRLLENNTAVFDAKTTGTSFDPDFCRLPAGTIDYYASTAGGFYVTESGKRFDAGDAVLENGYGMGENSLFVRSGGTYAGDSYFKIVLDKKSSYNIKAAGLEYYTQWGDDYNVRDFDAKYIYVTFDNVTSVTKLPSFGSNLVFSSGKWETVTEGGIPKFRLVLALRQPGVYAGNNSRYDADGVLTISFPVLTNSLAGMNIVIDPGHGMTSSGSVDPGAIGHVVEQNVNLAVAKKLKARLEELGANCVRLQTESEFLMTRLRPHYARQYNCDLFISLHSNCATGSASTRGTEVWYFTPFSRPLAASISESVAAYFGANVYSDGVNSNRGAKYSYYWVTVQQDFPSVMVELGFVTNYEDAMALASEKHQKGIADAIASGVLKYLGRSGISYSTDGSDGANGETAASQEAPSSEPPPSSDEEPPFSDEEPPLSEPPPSSDGEPLSSDGEPPFDEE
ncbi:MAG: N-acetylmuramoyl-L-alanine amidase, partial [Oscillospiraceae bacterium]|nr:N-acetylmuramoyl-L-alanine amidase [Oscillospiraceae bacterium]